KAIAGLPEETDTEFIWNFFRRLHGLRSACLPETEPGIKVRLTLDYAEDYWLLEFVRRIVGNMAHRREGDALCTRHPDLYLVNWLRNEQWKAAQEAKANWSI